MPVRIGDTGRTISPLSPGGKVEIHGIRYDARSEGVYIPAGCACIVLRGDHLGLVVRQIEAGQPIPVLPDAGQILEKAEFQRNSAEVEEVERREEANRRYNQMQTLKFGSIAAAGLGSVVGLFSGAIGWMNDWFPGPFPWSTLSFLAGSYFIGLLWGLVLFWVHGLAMTLVNRLLEGTPEFQTSMFLILLMLIGTATGFWQRFADGDLGLILIYSLGGTVVFFLAGLLFQAIFGVFFNS